MLRSIFLRRASEKNATWYFLAQSFGEKCDVAAACAELRTKNATSQRLAQVFGRKMRRRAASGVFHGGSEIVLLPPALIFSGLFNDKQKKFYFCRGLWCRPPASAGGQ
jgi:hypothetical protein